MSTRIYTGFVINTSDFADIMHTIQLFRPKAIELQNSIYRRFLERRGDSAETKKEWRERRWEIQRTQKRDIEVDTDFHALLFPTMPGKTFGLVYTEHIVWYNIWLEQPRVREYGYWDNTDRPDHLTQQEWYLRKDSWKKVLPNWEPPVLHGYSVELGDPRDPAHRI